MVQQAELFRPVKPLLLLSERVPILLKMNTRDFRFDYGNKNAF